MRQAPCWLSGTKHRSSSSPAITRESSAARSRTTSGPGGARCGEPRTCCAGTGIGPRRFELPTPSVSNLGCQGNRLSAVIRDSGPADSMLKDLARLSTRLTCYHHGPPGVGWSLWVVDAEVWARPGFLPASELSHRLADRGRHIHSGHQTARGSATFGLTRGGRRVGLGWLGRRGRRRRVGRTSRGAADNGGGGGEYENQVMSAAVSAVVLSWFLRGQGVC
jgi:hypothetical protein